MINNSRQHDFLKTSLALLSFLFLLLSCTEATISDTTHPTFTLTFDSKGGSDTPPQTIEQGTTANLPNNPTKTNTTFVGWFSDSSTTSPFDFNTPIINNTTLYAKWNVTITFDSQGGSSVNSQTIKEGSPPNLPNNPTKANLVFAGWHTNSTLGVTFGFNTPIINNTTLYARWKTTTQPYH